MIYSIVALSIILGICIYLTVISETPFDTFFYFAKVTLIMFFIYSPSTFMLAQVLTMTNTIQSLQNEKILIKNLETMESMGFIEEILLDKTGVITENKLWVASVRFPQQEILKNGNINLLPLKQSEML